MSNSTDLKEKITGIILAGGHSLRMGHDKGLLEFLGKPLVRHAIELLKPLVDEIIISANNLSYEQFGLPVQCDLVTDCGPIGGIFSSLSASGTDRNFILSCDMPLITPGLIRYILDKSDDQNITVPIHGKGLFEPLCACYPKKILELLNTLIKEQNYKLMNLLQQAPVKRVTISPALPFFQQDLFFNVNTGADLKRAEKYFGRS